MIYPKSAESPGVIVVIGWSDEINLLLIFRSDFGVYSSVVYT
jgi:hypothetical protein